MCLPVLLRSRVVELKGTQACAGHQQESDVLDVFDILLVRVLENNESAFVGVRSLLSTYVEDLKDPGFTDNCTAAMSIRWAQ